MTRSIPDLLKHTVARRGSATALVAGDASMTFAELDDASDRFAAFLASVGVVAEDRVIVGCENVSRRRSPTSARSRPTRSR